MKTQVAIVGAGPAGLLLGHLLLTEGIACIVVAQHSADYVQSRIRAGLLEPTTNELLERLRTHERLHFEDIREEGVCFDDGERFNWIDTLALIGKRMTVYGQTEVTRDLIEAVSKRGLEILWEAKDVALHEIQSDAPSVSYAKYGQTQKIDARFVVGCDGFHGSSRQSIPVETSRKYKRAYPSVGSAFLPTCRPCHANLIYANHDRGFAPFS